MAVRVMKSAENQRLPLALTSVGFLAAVFTPSASDSPALRSQDLCKQRFGQADLAVSHQHWDLSRPGTKTP